MPVPEIENKKIIYMGKSFPFELSETKEITKDNKQYGIIKGYASTYGNRDRGGDIIAEGAFKNSIERHKKTNRPIRMLFQHDTQQIIGGYPIDDVIDDTHGLFVTGKINLDTQKGKEAYALAKQGVLTDLSIGFSVNEDGYDADTDSRVFKDLELWEISPVSEPMNPQANIVSVKNKVVKEDKEFPQIESMKDVESCLKDSGLSSNQRKILISKIKEFSVDNRDDCDQESKENDNRDDCDKLVNALKEFETNAKVDDFLKELNKSNYKKEA